MTEKLNYSQLSERLLHELSVENAIGIHKILLDNAHNFGLSVPQTYERLFEILSNGELPTLEGKESAIKYSGGSALLSASSGKRATLEKLLNAYFHLSISEKDKIELSTSTDLVIPEQEDLTVLFKSTKADYGLSGDLEFEYSRQNPTIATQHSENLLTIAFNSTVKKVYLVGEGATRVIRSPYPVVSHALKVLCLLKTVVVDGEEYKGVKGALQLELKALGQTSTTRGKAMLKGAISPRKSTIESNGLEWCITNSLARLPESLRIWSLEYGAFDGYELAYYFRTIIGEPRVPLEYDRVYEKVVYAEQKINAELEQYGIPAQELTNKEFLAEFLSSGDWENEVSERRCANCNRVIQKNWKRCPFEE